jgi:hypothetical protein
MNAPIEFSSASPRPLVSLAILSSEKVREALSATASALAEISEALAKGKRENVSKGLEADTDRTTWDAIVSVHESEIALGTFRSESEAIMIARERARSAYQEIANARALLGDTLRESYRNFWAPTWFAERAETLARVSASLLASASATEGLINVFSSEGFPS